jgi:subtilisin family serine protease
LTTADIVQLRVAGFGVDAVTRGVLFDPVFELTLPRDISLAEARQVIQTVEERAVVDLNHYYYPDEGPPACTGPACEAPQLIGWSAPAFEGCGALPLIGLIDTGIDVRNPALRGQAIEIVDPEFSGGARSSSQHGTAIAALLAGRAAGPAPGLLPGARIIAVDGFYRAGNRDRTDVARLVQSIEALASRGVGILNLSLSGPPNQILERTIAAALAKGIVVVAAAGNKGPAGEPSYPGAYEGVLAVTAVDRQLNVYRRATHGSYIALAAPGVDLWTAGPQPGRKSGTSYAVPFVSAVAALLRSAEPSLGVSEVSAILRLSARDLGEPGRDDTFGWGLVQAQAACANPRALIAGEPATRRLGRAD